MKKDGILFPVGQMGSSQEGKQTKSSWLGTLPKRTIGDYIISEEWTARQQSDEIKLIWEIATNKIKKIIPCSLEFDSD